MAATLGKRNRPRPAPMPVARPLARPRAPAVSPVSRIAKQPVASRTLGKHKPQSPMRPPTSVSSPIANPQKKSSLGKSSGGGGGALPADNMPDTAPEEQTDRSLPMTDEEQAYYEQSSNAEVPVTSEGLFTMNNPMPKSVWQRIKDWFHDIFAGEEGISAPLSSVHIRDNVMHVASIVFNQDGAHYVVTRIPCPAARGRDGSVQISGENPQWLNRALQEAKYSIVQKTESADTRQIADVIERARAGDQNAYALIAMVRANAQAGNPRAIASARAFRDYLDKHPVESSMGSELTKKSDRAKKARAAIVFANGKYLDPEVLREFGSSFGDESECFFQGARDWNQNVTPSLVRNADPYRLQVYEIGQVLGRARAIQQMRNPNVLISSYDPVIGWELGE